MKKLTAEKMDNIMGAMSCIVTGLCLAGSSFLVNWCGMA